MKWDQLRHGWACAESRFDHIKYHQQYVARQLTIVNTSSACWYHLLGTIVELQRPESNKDEIWCGVLGSPLMRGEGKLSGNTKQHPASCLLWLAGRSQEEEEEQEEEERGVCLPHFCQCALCVSVQYLKTTHARLCYSQLPSSWHGNWKTSSENNKESLACCACCQ